MSRVSAYQVVRAYLSLRLILNLKFRLRSESPKLLSHHTAAPWHFLYFFPEPHGHGSLRPTFGSLRMTVLILPASSPAAVAPWLGPVNCIEPRRLAARRRR